MLGDRVLAARRDDLGAEPAGRADDLRAGGRRRPRRRDDGVGDFLRGVGVDEEEARHRLLDTGAGYATPIRRETELFVGRGSTPPAGRAEPGPYKYISSARVELDDEVRLHRHRIGHVGELRRADELAAAAVVVDLDILGHIALARLRRLEDERHRLGLLRDLDAVAVLHLEGGDVDAPAIDPDMAVVDELARRERRR